MTVTDVNDHTPVIEIRDINHSLVSEWIVEEDGLNVTQGGGGPIGLVTVDDGDSGDNGNAK